MARSAGGSATGPEPMTIGALSRRTGVSVKLIREYEDAGLVYSLGRSEGNYRLFGQEALWCLEVITHLRRLGLSHSEIRAVTGDYLQHPDLPIGPRLAEAVSVVRRRTEAQVDDLRGLLERLDVFETRFAQELAGEPGRDFRRADPRGADGT